MVRRRLPFAAVLTLAAGLGAGFLEAHGIDIEAGLHPPAVILRAAYSGAEAVAYAAVTIYGPGTPAVAFQSGNADAAGRFAFIPDREGEWRALFDDELGHREERRLIVGRDFFENGAGSPATSFSRSIAGSPVSVPPRLPLWLRALVGIALILGVSGFLFGFAARRRGRN